MSLLIKALALINFLLPAFGAAQDDAVVIGYEGRAVDRAEYAETLLIIRYRVETKRIVEPLLILSANGDPDILGLIATDENLPLAVREVAANAILDQLYIADPYFQACADHYLNILAFSPERSLRFKGALGAAILEHWCFLSDSNPGQRQPALYELQYAAMREPDSEARQAMSELLSGDPSNLIGGGALGDSTTREEPYRMFDSVPMPPLMEEDRSEGPVARAWRLTRWVASVNALLESSSEEPTTTGEPQVFNELNKAKPQQLRSYLSRFRVAAPAEMGYRVSHQPLVDFFINMALWSRDPYLRSLAMAPVAVGPAEQALNFLLDRLANDPAPLVRLAAADLLKAFCEDQPVRQRMVAVFREEADARVKLRMVHSLVWSFGGRPPPDIQAFLLGRLRDQQDKKLLGYIVAVLGSARVHSASEPLTELARSTSDSLLRRRIEEALRSIRTRPNN